MADDAAANGRTTIDHETIRRWAEERGGFPATVDGTAKGDEVGVLRIGFDDDAEDLEQIGWDEFFEKFEEKNLAFLHQNETVEGGTSRFHKFVNRR